MKRLPVLPTVLVALAIAAMIALGFWQIGRLHQKEALLRQYAANSRLPEIAFPRFPVGEQWLFRRAAAFCLKPVGWQRMSGRDRAGNTGWRQIARCSTGAEGPGFSVQLGIAPQAEWNGGWQGGEVRGYISQAPSMRPAILSAFGNVPPPELMLVTDDAPAGLRANARADLSAVPNNHLAYAVQWFAFAIIAAAIYALALRGRWRKAAEVVPPPRAS